MAVEIERKFLITPGAWSPRDAGDHIRQGYISVAPDRTVRVRTRGVRGYLTVKGPTVGLSRQEFEYEIPITDANEMLDRLCVAVLEKQRFLEPFEGHTWEIDVFLGANNGLVVAEVEMDSEQESVILPSWIASEVTGDYRYNNSHLARVPFSTWER
jgi:adenylate cyclase